ncbi:MAG TPA: hypothetical protein VMT36_04480 [Candidatus Saccharimonadia bacterium]|nr:hypothetical protein [Candidatus Saccharimonadia bacterium]
MQVPEINDADERYLEEIARDCERVLGAGIEIEGLELDANGDVVLRLRYRLGTTARDSEGRGGDLLSAHAALRRRLVEDRIALGFQALVWG